MGLRGALEAGRDYCDQSHTFWFGSNTFFSDVLDSVLAILACLLDTRYFICRQTSNSGRGRNQSTVSPYIREMASQLNS